MTEPSVSLGWAFLVARGRRAGYRSVLVPDFLVESNEYGILGEMVGGDSSSSGLPRIESFSAPAIGAITVAYQTERLTYGDLNEESLPADSTAAGHATDDLITDEHGRPLDLLYGFACRASTIRATHEADLLAARAEALPAYQRFLADEKGFTLEISKPFALHSVTSGPEAPSQRIPPSRDTVRPPRPPSVRPPAAAAARSLRARRGPRLDIIIGVLMAVIVLAIVWIVILRPPSPVTDDLEEQELGTELDSPAPTPPARPR